MKRTAYQITGQSFSEPTSLPDGFTVKAVEVEVDPKRVAVQNILNDAILEIREGWTASPTVAVYLHGRSANFSLASALQVRDCLNAILEGGEETTPKGRVFKDNDPGETWRWFETKPSMFTYAPSWDDAVEASANRRGTGCTDWPLAKLEKSCGPPTDVTGNWQVDL